MTDDTFPQNGDRPLAGRLAELVEWLLGRKYLSGLSSERREELRDDLTFLRQSVARQRPPRIAVVGRTETDLPDLLRDVTGSDIEDASIKEALGRGRWYEYEVRGTTIELLDLRTDDGTPPLRALERQTPDLVVMPWLYSSGDAEDPDAAALEEVSRHIEAVASEVVSAVGVVEGDSIPDDVTMPSAIRQLRSNLRERGLDRDRVETVDRDDPRALADALLDAAPLEARLQMTRTVGHPDAKRRVAQNIVRVSAGIAAGIASMPLPVADIVPMTTVQVATVAAVAHISGRPFELKTVGEFLAAMGLNVGAGYALRELARALVQFVPVAGSAISSGIATGATYAIGNAAITYFIDD